MKKSLIVAGAVATVGVSALGLGVASAGNIPTPEAVFNSGTSEVGKGEVKHVALKDRGALESEMKQEADKRLDTLVSEGKLTKEQKAKIVAKQAEWKAQMEADFGVPTAETKEELRVRAQQRQAELESWAKENNIPSEYLYLVLGTPAQSGNTEPSSGTANL